MLCFCSTMKRTSYMYTYTPSLLISHLPLHSTPLGHHQLELPVLYNMFPQAICFTHDSVYMSILKSLSTKSTNPIKKWAEDLNRHLSKEDIKIANKHMKRCSKSLLLCVLSHSVISNSLWPHGPLGQNIGVGICSLLQGLFPIHALNAGLLHCRRILYQLSYQGSPWRTIWRFL